MDSYTQYGGFKLKALTSVGKGLLSGVRKSAKSSKQMGKIKVGNKKVKSKPTTSTKATFPATTRPIANAKATTRPTANAKANATTQLGTKSTTTKSAQLGTRPIANAKATTRPISNANANANAKAKATVPATTRPTTQVTKTRPIANANAKAKATAPVANANAKAKATAPVANANATAKPTVKHATDATTRPTATATPKPTTKSTKPAAIARTTPTSSTTTVPKDKPFSRLTSMGQEALQTFYPEGEMESSGFLEKASETIKQMVESVQEINFEPPTAPFLEEEAEATEETEETAPVVIEPVPEPVTETVTAIAKVIEAPNPVQRRDLILSHLEKCLPSVQTVDDFSEVLIDCVSQDLGELLLPNQNAIRELSVALTMMRDDGVDFTDPELVKILLFGSTTSREDLILDFVQGYKEVERALSKIVDGDSIPVQVVPAEQTGGCGKMYYEIKQEGGCGCDLKYQPKQRGGSCGKDHNKKQYGDNRKKQEIQEQVAVKDVIDTALGLIEEASLFTELQKLQEVFRNKNISRKEYEEIFAELLECAQNILAKRQ